MRNIVEKEQRCLFEMTHHASRRHQVLRAMPTPSPSAETSGAFRGILCSSKAFHAGPRSLNDTLRQRSAMRESAELIAHVPPKHRGWAKDANFGRGL
jgi:hypothetical protein